MRNASRAILTSFLILSQLSWAMGDSNDAFQFLQEEAQVVTASHREQLIKDVPAAVDVITAEEIQASGATNLADLLRFRAGMDVIDARSVSGNRAIVAVRGFPQEFVNSLQVLIDGRSVYEPIASEVFWDQLPVQMQDIERIEIIRGPNAVLYGSGAGLGVINIITKKPQGAPAATAMSEGGNEGFTQSAGSLDNSVKGFNYRASYTYQQNNSVPSASGSTLHDYMNAQQANIRTDWSPRPGSELELFAGGSWNREGVPTFPTPGDTFDQNFQMLKWSQKVGDHSTIEALSSRNQFVDTINNSQVWQYDDEILHRLDWWSNRMNTTYGINYRGATADSPLLFSSQPHKQEDLWNGYFNQAIQVQKTLSLIGGASLEGIDVGVGGLDTNYQLASIWTPLTNHAFRATYGVSHSVPSLFDTQGSYQSNPTTTVQGDANILPEKLTTYEIGDDATALDKHLQINSSLYYTVIKDMNNSFVQSATFYPVPAITLGFGNVDEAIARGFETEFKYRFTPAESVYVNYTYEHITDQAGDAGDVTQNTPAHKVNFGGMAKFGHGFSGSLNVGYKDHYFISSDGYNTSAAIPAYWRLDARVAYAVNPRTELFLAGQNLAASTHEEFPDGLAIARTYQGGVSIKFGESR